MKIKREMLLRYTTTNYGAPQEEIDGWRVLDPRDGAPLTDEIFKNKKLALEWVRENNGKCVYD
jgi:predicted methyltransferase